MSASPPDSSGTDSSSSSSSAPSTGSGPECNPAEAADTPKRCFPEWDDAIPMDDDLLMDKHRSSLPIVIAMSVFIAAVVCAMAGTFACWWQQRRERQKQMTEEAHIQEAVAEVEADAEGEWVPMGDYIDEVTVYPIEEGGTLPQTTQGAGGPDARRRDRPKAAAGPRKTKSATTTPGATTPVTTTPGATTPAATAAKASSPATGSSPAATGLRLPPKVPAKR